MVFVRLRHGANLGAPDGIATRFIFLLIGSEQQTLQHLDTLSSIARLMSDNVFHFELTYAKTQQDVADAIERHINRNVLAAPPKPREVFGWPEIGSTSICGNQGRYQASASSLLV